MASTNICEGHDSLYTVKENMLAEQIAHRKEAGIWISF